MKSKIILKTTRLELREFTINDANFILTLLNAPNWLEFIGDKNVKTLKEAKEYITNGPIASYKKNGFGLWLVQLKTTKIPIGMCGLVDRDTLDDIDIGFALLPNYEGFGYALEVASATMAYANYNLGFDTVIAITDVENISSINLLQKLGLRFEKTLELSKNDEVLVFAQPTYYRDREKIDELVKTFFNLFTNTEGNVSSIKKIYELFIAKGIIINNTSESPQIYNLEEFIAPREKLLNDGTLTDFCEREVSSKTEVFKDIAHRWSLYKKSGNLSGIYFESKGVKTIQLVKINKEWKIASVVWND